MTMPPGRRYLVPFLSPAQPSRRGVRLFMHPARSNGRTISRSSTCRRRNRTTYFYTPAALEGFIFCNLGQNSIGVADIMSNFRSNRNLWTTLFPLKTGHNEMMRPLDILILNCNWTLTLTWKHKRILCFNGKWSM